MNPFSGKSLRPRRPQQNVAGYKLYPLVSTCRRQHVSCIGDKIVASLSPVCCLIQVDPDVNE